MKVVEYFDRLTQLIESNPWIASWDCIKDIRTSYEGFFKARLYFVDGSWLEFREFVNCSGDQPQKYAYSYHYQNSSVLIFRYDNTPHFPGMASFPHHKHLSTGNVQECPEPVFSAILAEIETFLERSLPE